MRLAVPVIALSLAACADEPTPREKAAADAAAVAEVEAHQDAPPEALVPDPIAYAEIEKYGLFGAGCSFAPEGGGMGAIVLAMPDRGYMMKDGELLTFAADKGSGQIPLGAWRKYDGKDYSFEFTIDESGGEQSGMETFDYDAQLIVRDGKDRVVYEAAGMAQCGS